MVQSTDAVPQYHIVDAIIQIASEKENDIMWYDCDFLVQTWTPSGGCHKYERTSFGDELPSSQPSVHLGHQNTFK